MRISLHNSARKTCVLLAALLVAGAYTFFIAKEYLAARYADRPDVASLRKAAWLQPGNAEYQYRLGRYFWLVERSPDAAVASYRAAVTLNPYSSRYWLDLAGVYQLLGDTARQQDALEHAVLANPTTPEVAWEAANLYVVEGETDKALKEFRVVLQNDPYLPLSALDLCWRIKPDIDVLLRDAIPPMASVDSIFLNYLGSKKESAAAVKVWAQLVKLQQPVERRYVFDYIRYLIAQQDVDQARMVWQQAGSLSGLSAYQPTSENLVVNGDFSLDVLNGGFGWQYQPLPDVSLSIDPTQVHAGDRSLSMVFDSRGLNDAGILQTIPVQPNTNYEFSAYFKSEDMQGAGGPELAVQDFYKGTVYFISEDMKDADFWKRIGGNIMTGPDTRLLVVHIQRVPAGSPIKGKLWLDDVRLAARPQQGQ